jgi:hypothetical protein
VRSAPVTTFRRSICSDSIRTGDTAIHRRVETILVGTSDPSDGRLMTGRFDIH